VGGRNPALATGDDVHGNRILQSCTSRFQAISGPNIAEGTRETVAVHFRTAIRRRRDETYLVDRLFFLPVGMAVLWIAQRVAVMHHGRLSAYVAYLIGFLLLLLLILRLH